MQEDGDMTPNSGFRVNDNGQKAERARRDEIAINVMSMYGDRIVAARVHQPIDEMAGA